MANRSNDGSAVYGVALIGLGMLVHYGWSWFPVEHQAQVWNAAGALARLLAVCVAAECIRSSVFRFAAAWWAAEECLVIGCSLAYIAAPWDVPAGQAQCSALLQFDLGRVGLCVAVLALLASVRFDSVHRNNGGR